MKEEKCTVIENRNINKNFFLMKLEAKYISNQSKPGNFIMLAASQIHYPLLKRPFGILNSSHPFTWLYYEVIGKGTELISSLKPGDSINAIGPLGNSFPTLKNRSILLVAGGRGIAPLYYAIDFYTHWNDVYLIYGAKSKEGLNLLDLLSSAPLKKTFLYTDDGSIGKKGWVTTDIREIIKENKIQVTISCGPDSMFKNLSNTISHLKLENYVSLEALMGCGFGICYSCVVKTSNDEYKKVCTDGPIFKMEDIVW